MSANIDELEAALNMVLMPATPEPLCATKGEHSGDAPLVASLANHDANFVELSHRIRCLTKRLAI